MQCVILHKIRINFHSHNMRITYTLILLRYTVMYVCVCIIGKGKVVGEIFHSCFIVKTREV